MEDFNLFKKQCSRIIVLSAEKIQKVKIQKNNAFMKLCSMWL